MTKRQHLPAARGPISGWLIGRLSGLLIAAPRVVWGADVLIDDDVQLALHCIYELSYRGFDGVDDALERAGDVLVVRNQLEDAMERRLREAVGPLPTAPPQQVLTELAAPGSGPSLSQFLYQRASRDELREFAVHRSAYQLKEADPHSWGLPRVSGRAKAALVEIQSDEYGRGAPGRSHAELFATTMESLGLDPSYGFYTDLLPATTLATGNLISLFGMQRRLLPALIGHLALFEMTSIGPMQRYSDALRSVGVAQAGREFFDVHVVADAEHEVLALSDLVGGYLADDPGAGPEICFGARALSHMEGAFAEHLMASFAANLSSLRAPIARDLAEPA